MIAIKRPLFLAATGKCIRGLPITIDKLMRE
jgi:hypothetical protein